MDITNLPNRPLSLDEVNSLQENSLCTPLFFLLNEDSLEDIVVVATTENNVHKHIALDPESEEWTTVASLEITDSLKESELLAFNLFGEIAEWLKQRYDEDEIALIENSLEDTNLSD